jgi:hypothetical protein
MYYVHVLHVLHVITALDDFKFFSFLKLPVSFLSLFLTGKMRLSGRNPVSPFQVGAKKLFFGELGKLFNDFIDKLETVGRHEVPKVLKKYFTTFFCWGQCIL